MQYGFLDRYSQPLPKERDPIPMANRRTASRLPVVPILVAQLDLTDRFTTARPEGGTAPPLPAMPTERRRERRHCVRLPVSVWGSDVEGRRFAQVATVSNLSTRGALLVDVRHNLRAGDLIGICRDGRQARFRIVWARHAQTGERMAAVQRLLSDACLWEDALDEIAVAESCGV